MKQKTKKVKTVKKEGLVSLLIKNESNGLSGMVLYHKTMKDQDGVTEEFYELLKEKAISLRDRAIIQVAWESGTRVGELVSLQKANLEGDHLRFLVSKGKPDCLNCGINTRSHRDVGLKTKKINEKSCHDWSPIYKKVWKNILLSPKALGDLKAYMSTVKGETIFNFTTQGVNGMMKVYEKTLTIHDFRRGKGIWLINNGATKEQLIAFLGHKDYQSISHYMAHQEDSLNEFLNKVYQGLPTKKIGDMDMMEFAKYLKEIQSFNS